MAKMSPILPKFDNDNCISCGWCETVCPYGAITMEDGYPVVDDTVCMGCGWCMGQCKSKNQVITMVRRGTDRVVWNGYGVHDKWVLDEE